MSRILDPNKRLWSGKKEINILWSYQKFKHKHNWQMSFNWSYLFLKIEYFLMYWVEKLFRWNECFTNFFHLRNSLHGPSKIKNYFLSWKKRLIKNQYVRFADLVPVKIPANMFYLASLTFYLHWYIFWVENSHTYNQAPI